MPTFDRFQYLDDSYRKRTAYLTPAYEPDGFLGTGTHDPQWYVIHDEDGSINGPYDYLTYVGENLAYYHIQVHAQIRPGTGIIRIWCSHEYRDGGGGFEDSNDFTIRDWSNTPVHLHVQDEVANHTAPLFSTP